MRNRAAEDFFHSVTEITLTPTLSGLTGTIPLILWINLINYYSFFYVVKSGYSSVFMQCLDHSSVADCCYTINRSTCVFNI